jgi:hypothetical protein
LAQPSLPAFELQRLQFEPGALGSLVVGTGRTLDAGVFRASVQVQYEQQALTFEEEYLPRGGQSLVEGKFTTHVTAAYGLLLQREDRLSWRGSSALLQQQWVAMDNDGSARGVVHGEPQSQGDC